jgi:SAM-dependent methyltransferase
VVTGTPFYCQIARSTISTSPSVSMLLASLVQSEKVLDILDLGCGNGRNSLAVSCQHPSKVTILDSDPVMLEQAIQNYSRANLAKPRYLLGKIEDLCRTPHVFDDQYDIIILSYVLQHVKPDYYDLIADFCKNKTRRYLTIDVYWNPSHCKIGEYVQIGSRFWYGMTHKQLIEILAPRFRITNSRKLISKQAPYLTFSFLCEPGREGRITWNSNEIDYELLMKQTRIRAPARSCMNRKMSCDELRIDQLPSVTLLTKVYPENIKSIIGEIEQYKQSHKFATRKELASVFLHCCRNYRLPILLEEIARDFAIPVKEILYEAFRTDSLKPITPIDYIDRIIRLLGISETIKNRAISRLSSVKEEGRNPAVLAAVSVVVACEEEGYSISRRSIAGAVEVTTVSIRNILRAV